MRRIGSTAAGAHAPRRWLTLLAAMAIIVVATSLSGGVALAASQAPDTTITSSPASPISSTSASFAFTSKGGATFTCKLDTGTSGSCTSPKAYSGLAQGSHTFSVFATWKGIPDPSPATKTWIVDTTLPTTPTGLAATTPTATSVKLTWAAATDNLAIGGYDVWRDGAALTSVGAVLTYTDSTVLAGSTHTYQVRARDTAGNVSALSASVSATTPAPPDTIIDTGPPAGTTSASATFTFHSSPAGATFTCKLDTAPPAACTSPKSYSGLTQAVHTFTVFATLNAIADPTPATATWTVDTTPPTAPTGLTATSLSPTSVQLTWTAATDNTGVTGYDVIRDGAALATIGSVTTYTDSTVTAGSTPVYTVKAFDIAGNRSPSSAPAGPPPPLAPQLTRMPYLTDLVGLNATVNFATDRSIGVASVKFGPSSGGTCTLTTNVTATRITVAVNGVFEYQWKAPLTLPATGSYCYRAYLGTADLLAGNAAPVFQAQVALGSTSPFTFAVLGDWGETDSTGANPYQAGVMSQISRSGATFAITTGDQGYPSGGQNEYGDLQSQTAGIFGMPFWGGVGSTLPIFPSIGNHGFARSDAVHPHFANWPQDVAVATSSGRGQVDAYGSVNGSTPGNYPSSWYAFSAGNARFYVLTAAWADQNFGTGTVYSADYLSHWLSTSPEYQWLTADLAAHPSGLKFAFFHYPLYSDQPSENSDTFLQGNTSLEGLLASNGVNIAFNGHAHIYQRNSPATGPGRQSLVSYVTGGGGATAQSLGTCSANDQYAVGWSYTNNAGTKCGTAPVPTSPAQVHHFLKVTINGGSVTVTPTDSTGRTFDVQTYTFTPKPDTFLDTTPPAGSPSSSASFTFHASSASATYTCKLDAGIAAACTSPKAYTGLTNGSHTFTVTATVGGVVDPLPATYTWTVDTIAPAAPGSFAASATSPFSVALSWTAATDNLGITGYDIVRDGTLLATIPPATSYVDTAVVGSTQYSYQIRARDVAGNLSVPVTAPAVTTPPPPLPVFADGFESGTLSAWSPVSGLVVEGATVHNGAKAAEGNTTAAGTYAKKTLSSSYPDAYARVWFQVVSQTTQVNLLRLRAGAASVGYAYIETTGQLGFHNDAIGATGTNYLSTTIPAPGWHALELHVLTGGSSGMVELWLDNVRIADLSGATTTSAASVDGFQIGEAQGTNQIYDVVFDDAAFGTARLGPVADGAAPSVPGSLSANATSAFSVALTWAASTDDLGIAGYDVFRDGVLVASVGNVTAYTDTGALASSTYTYAVRAQDTSGNPSGLSAPATATTPAAPIPAFADGFESGDFSGWTSNSGLSIEGTNVRTGSFAAQGVGPVFARKTLSNPSADTYTRVAFFVNSWGTQAALIRLRDASAVSIGNLYLSNIGHVGFHVDVAGSSNTQGITTSTVAGPGWHALELHLAVNGASSTLEVWLDGAPVSGLPATVDLVASGPVAIFQIGDSAANSNDILYDDAAFGTSRFGPISDSTAPSVPGGLAATAAAFSVALSWAASTDDVGIGGYDVYRGGTLVASLGNVTAYTDTTVLASTAYSYTVRARDTSGNPSAQSAALPVTTLAPAAPVFADGFESGDFSAWTTNSGLTVEGTNVRSGSFAAEGNGAVFVKKTLSTPSADAYTRVAFFVKTGGTQASLIRLRDAGNLSIGNVYLSNIGHLGFHVDVAGSTNTVGITTSTAPAPGWHALELHLGVSGSSSALEVWLDGAPVSGFPSTVDLVTSGPVAQFQIGDSAANSNDILYDDAAFGTSRLGPAADTTPPSVPGSLAATPASFSVALSWTASTDDVGIAGYDVFRDGALVASLGNVTSYTDTTVLASTTYSYTVRALDTSGNPSGQSAPASATTSASSAPVFADGFESGDFSAWSSSTGLSIEGATVHNGANAAEGNTVNGNVVAQKSLGSSYTDGYSRVWFDVVSQSGQVTLLGFRSGTNVIGSVFLTAGGKLGMTGGNSAVGPGPGWHALEYHLSVNGSASAVQVWLDGTLIGDLPTTINVGAFTSFNGLQVGDTQTARTYDIAYDDAAFGPARLGLTVDSPPSVPANLAATTPSPYTVSLTWDASTDDLGVAGYDLFRDGSPYQSLGNVLTYADTVAENATHTYAVRARDTSGNRSALSAAVPATTPADNPPTVPTDLAWTAPSRTSVVLTWTASTDDVGVAGYDVYRDSVLLASLGNVLTATDSTVTAGSTHDYAVLARDGHGHSSALTAPVSATTPTDSPPTVPANVAASATTPNAVSVTWDASTDDVGVVDYDLYRDGALLAGHLTTLSYSDVAVSSGATYDYAVRARDGAGNVSALSAPASVTVPAPTPIFANGFESGDPAWTTNTLIATGTTVHGGSAAAEANLTSAAGKSARKTVPSASDVYGRVWVYIKSQTSNATLAGFRSGSLIASINLGTDNRLNVVVVGAATRTSSIQPTQNAWHALEYHFVFGATPSSEVWLDGVLITSLSGPLPGATPVSTNEFQVGDTNTSRTYDIVWDDAAYGTSRLGQ